MSDLGKEIGDRLMSLATRAAEGLPAIEWQVTVDLFDDDDEGVRRRWYSCDVNFEFDDDSDAEALIADLALYQFKKLCRLEKLEIGDEGGGDGIVGCEIIVRLPDEPM